MTKKEEVKKEEGVGECREKEEDIAEEVTGTEPVVEDTKAEYREMKLAKRAAKKKARAEKTGRYAEAKEEVKEEK